MLTGDLALIDEAKRLALHGMSARRVGIASQRSGNFEYDVPSPGFKYNMSDILASIGLIQLRRLNELYERRLSVVQVYEESFGSSQFAGTLKVKSDRESSRHLFPILLELEKLTIDRAQFIAEMQARNIGCSVHFQARAYDVLLRQKIWLPRRRRIFQMRRGLTSAWFRCP